MRIWWVNQGGSYKIEHANEFMWSPKREKDNSRSQAYENMKLVAPGDLILSHYDKRIRSIGTAQSYCFSCPRPEEFPTDQNLGNNDGWKVNVKYRHDVQSLSPKENFEVLKPLLPQKYGPLDINGVAVMKLYLVELETDLSDKILNLMGLIPADFPSLQKHDFLGEIKQQELDERLEKEIFDRNDIPQTEKEYLRKSRIGQGLFRERVSEIENKCRVSSVSNCSFLIASHIKPWRDSDNRERLDGENGLLLSPNIDCLFDKNFISFSDEGYLIISPLVDIEIREKFGLIDNLFVGSFTSGQKTYLAHHRSRLKDSE